VVNGYLLAVIGYWLFAIREPTKKQSITNNH
jgi:hypothetical protein